MRVNKIIETNKHYENKKRTEFIQKSSILMIKRYHSLKFLRV
ncbi:hypothetical protein [Clostridium tetanomorphum]|nr:hypothetical protein [Clostridium tetanomorphum]SQB91988.1 Uncharacterised protein [Clostridium tetanomorphum]